MKLSFPLRIYLAALILRLIPILLTRGLGIGLDDMFQYDMLARSIASGNGYRWYAQKDLKLLEPYVKFDLSTAKGYDPRYGLYTSFRAPLYPTFLAIVYFINGTDFSRFFAARLAQVILLGAPLAPLTYYAAIHLFPEQDKEARSAKIAGWLVAAYPMLLVYPLGLGTENPFFLFLLSSFLFILKSIEKPTNWNLVISGVLLALTSLTRSVILPFAGLAIIYLIYILGKKALLVPIIFFLILTPWIIRNSLLHHKLTNIETSMGYNLYLGYHPKGNGSFVFGPSLDLLTIMDDSERDEIGTQKAIQFIQAQPERIFPLAINRLGFFFGLEKRVLMYFYSNDLIGYVPRGLLLTASAILLLPFVIISILAALSLPALHWNERTVLLAILFGAYLLPHVFILAEDRFHLALVPLIATLAVQGWTFHSNRQAQTTINKTALILSFIIIFLLLLNWGLELHRDADKIAVLLGPNGNKSFFPY